MTTECIACEPISPKRLRKRACKRQPMCWLWVQVSVSARFSSAAACNLLALSFFRVTLPSRTDGTAQRLTLMLAYLLRLVSYSLDALSTLDHKELYQG